METRTPFPDTFVRDLLKTGTMKEITLTQGKIAFIDDEDYCKVANRKWVAVKNRKNWYAYRWSKGGIKYRHKIWMHRLIMNTPNNMIVDHIDHNGLNNQKHNLRNCVHAQNMLNKNSFSKSGYLGVYSSGNCYAAVLSINGKLKHIGHFKTKIEAAKAVDKIVNKTRGEFANLNFK